MDTDKVEMAEMNAVSNVATSVVETIVPLKIEANFDDIFITEKDTFEVKVQYYKDNGKFFVESVDSDFVPEHDKKEISITFKLPNQGDVTSILGMVYNSATKDQSNEVVDFTRLELARFMCLIRKWSLEKQINNENILALNPKMVKAILNKIREQIGAEGIF